MVHNILYLKCVILNNSKNQSFKLVHSIYTPMALTGQFCQIESFIELDI